MEGGEDLSLYLDSHMLLSSPASWSPFTSLLPLSCNKITSYCLNTLNATSNFRALYTYLPYAEVSLLTCALGDIIAISTYGACYQGSPVKFILGVVKMLHYSVL